jgi:hypothetical protein
MSSAHNAVIHPVSVAFPHTATSPGRLVFANRALKAAAGFWYVVVLIGQLIFAFAIASYFGLTAARGAMDKWGRVLTHGIIPGDHIGNTALVVHIVSAVFIILSGSIQLLPQVRRIAPTFHRWNGRAYMVTAFTVSLGGLYLMWVRGTVGGLVAHIAQTIDAFLIMLCAVMALRYALARDFKTHRRWALRLYLVVSASLFVRAATILFAIGADPGVTINVIAFAQYLFPLAVLELYLRVQDRGTAAARIAVAGFLVILTLGLGAGIATATTALFRPRIKAAFDTRTSIGDVLAATIASSGIEAAERQYRQLKTAPPTNYNFGEPELNGLGYQLLRANKFDDAVRIFQLNVEGYPKSANAWDSLAEGYMDAGNQPLAIANYQKSLGMNPKNANAVQMLKKLETR